MATQDDFGTTRANDAADPQPTSDVTRLASKRNRRGNQNKLVANLHKIRLTSTVSEDTWPVAAPLTPRASSSASIFGKFQLRLRRKPKKDRLQDWDKWSKFRLWRRTRPFWGSILMILGSLLLLAFPLSFLQFAFLLNSLWASILIGALLLVIALVQLFVPSYSVLIGAIGIVLSLTSFITSSVGGLVIGMLLGIIGSTLSLSWRPVKRSKLVATRSTTI